MTCQRQVIFLTDSSKQLNIKSKLSNYESLVDELENNAKKLSSLCEDVYYPDGNVNNKCFNYKSIYEQVVNFFLSDIEVYNKNVKEYNDYQTANNLTFLVKEYKSKKKYIDYNEDGVFDGKEDIEVEFTENKQGCKFTGLFFSISILFFMILLE